MSAKTIRHIAQQAALYNFTFSTELGSQALRLIHDSKGELTVHSLCRKLVEELPTPVRINTRKYTSDALQHRFCNQLYALRADLGPNPRPEPAPQEQQEPPAPKGAIPPPPMVEQRAAAPWSPPEQADLASSREDFERVARELKRLAKAHPGQSGFVAAALESLVKAIKDLVDEEYDIDPEAPIPAAALEDAPEESRREFQKAQ